jgi:hypothetical protein
MQEAPPPGSAFVPSGHRTWDQRPKSRGEPGEPAAATGVKHWRAGGWIDIDSAPSPDRYGFGVVLGASCALVVSGT